MKVQVQHRSLFAGAQRHERKTLSPFFSSGLMNRDVVDIKTKPNARSLRDHHDSAMLPLEYGIACLGNSPDRTSSPSKPYIAKSPEYRRRKAH